MWICRRKFFIQFNRSSSKKFLFLSFNFECKTEFPVLFFSFLPEWSVLCGYLTRCCKSAEFINFMHKCVCMCVSVSVCTYGMRLQITAIPSWLSPLFQFQLNCFFALSVLFVEFLFFFFNFRLSFGFCYGRH